MVLNLALEKATLHRIQDRAARQFQELWKTFRISYKHRKAATTIQCCWRKHRDRLLFIQLKHEISAIILIEKRINVALQSKNVKHISTERARKQRSKHEINNGRKRLGLAWNHYI